MQTQEWKLLDAIYGDLQAELLRGLLEANNIPVVLSREGAGHNVYPVLVGPLARVEILVPSASFKLAEEILHKYYTGDYEKETSNLQIDDDGVPEDNSDD